MKLRSLLFVPGDSERKFEKAAGSSADALILDLEDSVAPSQKPAARAHVAGLIDRGEKRGWSLFVRVNALDSGLTLDDLAAVVRPGLDALMIPKANGAADVERIANYLDALEARAGMALGSVKLMIVATETAKAMFALGSYAPAHPRLLALTWGGEDLAAALGATANREEDGAWTFPYQVARAQCLFAASAAAAASIDTVYVDFRDIEGFERDCQNLAARRLYRPDGHSPGPGRRDQSLLCALGRRDRAGAKNCRGLRGQSGRRRARDRRPDGRHSASEGRAENSGVSLRSGSFHRVAPDRPVLPFSTKWGR